MSERQPDGVIHEGAPGDNGYGPKRVHRLVWLPAGSQVLLGDGRLHTTTEDGVWPEYCLSDDAIETEAEAVRAWLAELLP